jgi:hypothetical protein
MKGVLGEVVIDNIGDPREGVMGLVAVPRSGD